MTTTARPRLFATFIGVVSVLGIALAVPRLRAERVYGDARGYGSSPLDDQPGRVEAYLEAERLDPTEFVYPFRRGQILLGRVRSAKSPEKDSLRASVVALRRAMELQPLEPRVRATLAEALLRDRDVAGALTQIEHAVRLGPRHPDVLVRAVDLHMRLWRGRRDVGSLRRAFEIARVSASMGSSYPAQAAARRVVRAGNGVLPDLVQATEDDPELRTFLAEQLRRLDSELADALVPPGKRP